MLLCQPVPLGHRLIFWIRLGLLVRGEIEDRWVIVR
jgi:hypothetical protein